jgi:hypothetical protein
VGVGVGVRNTILSIIFENNTPSENCAFVSLLFDQKKAFKAKPLKNR